MGFTRRQKIALIISLWLYFLWIVAICSIMRAQFKGKLLSCIIIGGIGCVVVFALYVLAFSGAYHVPKKITHIENIQKIKNVYRSKSIWGIYICIIGFFSLSLSVLLLDKDEIHSVRLAWLIVDSALFLTALIVLCLSTYRSVASAIHTFVLQEKNDEIVKVEKCENNN